jgi:hypothetical protein
MVRSFLHMQDQRSVLRTEHVLTGTVSLPMALYGKTDERFAFFQEFHRTLAGLPGVRAAGGALHLHLGTRHLDGEPPARRHRPGSQPRPTDPEPQHHHARLPRRHRDAAAERS